jgi:hypothetical protein
MADYDVPPNPPYESLAEPGPRFFTQDKKRAGFDPGPVTTLNFLRFERHQAGVAAGCRRIHAQSALSKQTPQGDGPILVGVD